MKCTWTIIGVADVARSFKWYQSLFGQPKSAWSARSAERGLTSSDLAVEMFGT
jgi:hypothetical protein